MKLPKVLPEPEKPNNLPNSAIWLAGEGAGSWFVLEQIQNKNLISVTRYSPVGNFECSGVFFSESSFDISKPFELTYPSHCLKVTTIQNGKKIYFKKSE